MKGRGEGAWGNPATLLPLSAQNRFYGPLGADRGTIVSKTIKWRRLGKNDLIVCPGDGVVEKVLFNRSSTRGMRFVRTNRHDHIRKANDTVEKGQQP